MTDGTIGTFNLQQNAGFSGPALSVNGATLGFALSSAGSDQLVITGAANVSGTNVIDIATVGASLAPGSHTYDLITAASGLQGTFQFADGTSQTTVTVGDQTYRLSLGNSGTAETLAVDDATPLPVQPPPLIQTATVNYVKGELPASNIGLTWSTDTSAPANYTTAPASACFSTPAATEFGQIVVFGATVTPVDPGGPVPTGWVNFYDGSSELDSEQLDSYGYVAFRTAALGVGNHTIEAVYSGDANYAPGTPATLGVTVVNNAPDILRCSQRRRQQFGHQRASRSKRLRRLSARFIKTIEALT